MYDIFKIRKTNLIAVFSKLGSAQIGSEVLSSRVNLETGVHMRCIRNNPYLKLSSITIAYA